MSLTFGGVNSTAAYLAATCNFGRDATIKSKRKISTHYISIDLIVILVIMFCIVSDKKGFFRTFARLKPILHYVMTFLIATV